MVFTAPDVARRRASRAMHLRALGRSYDQIAQAVLPCEDHKPDGDPLCVALEQGCLPMYAHRSGAKRAVDRALEQEYAAGSDTREQLRRHQLAQIDLLLQGAMAEAIDPRNPLRYAAHQAATRLLDRRAKLLGLDAPTRIAVTSELDAEIEQMMGELGLTPDPAPRVV